MSNDLAIATVTGAVKLALHDAVGPLGASVSTARPAANGGNGAAPLVHLFLYQVTPNAALRQDDLPTWRGDGSLVHRAQVALDLHYLLTFHGDESKLQPQRLLGIAAMTLQQTPVVTTAAITQAKKDASLDLATSDLDEAVDVVRLRPTPLTLDELSKLWSIFFQVPYALSAAYEASVIVIESKRLPPSGLPVRDRNVRVVALNRPTIDSVTSADGPLAPITATSTLVLRGSRLRGEKTLVWVEGVEVEPLTLTDTELTFALAAVPAAARRAGVQGVQVVHKISFDDGLPPRPIFESNVAAFVLRPSVTPGATTSTSITLTVDPPVRTGQRVVLLLDGLGAAWDSYTFEAERPTADTNTLKISVAAVTPGNYLVRLQVDGAESTLVANAVSGKYEAPKVSVP